LRRLGNEAFLAKNYEQAITHYSNAIKLEPENAIFYSNRRLEINLLNHDSTFLISACYALLKKWQQSLEDAIVCLSKDSKSIKGYYRLAQAQIELGKCPLPSSMLQQP
jgi:tetratricopeptide (TPR) repeat protein